MIERCKDRIATLQGTDGYYDHITTSKGILLRQMAFNSGYGDAQEEYALKREPWTATKLNVTHLNKRHNQFRFIS